jgi:hypothetical protein
MSGELKQVEVPGDGNCFFYSVLLGLQRMHPDFVYLGRPITSYDNKSFIKTIRNNIDNAFIAGLNKINEEIGAIILHSINEDSCFAQGPTVIYLAHILNIRIRVFIIHNGILREITDTEKPSPVVIDVYYNGINHYNALIPENLLGSSDSVLPFSNALIHTDKINEFKKLLPILRNPSPNPDEFKKAKERARILLEFSVPDLSESDEKQLLIYQMEDAIEKSYLSFIPSIIDLTPETAIDLTKETKPETAIDLTKETSKPAIDLTKETSKPSEGSSSYDNILKYQLEEFLLILNNPSSSSSNIDVVINQAIDLLELDNFVKEIINTISDKNQKKQLIINLIIEKINKL